ILPRLPPDVREIVSVTHNETPFYTNDGMHKSIGCLKLSEYERCVNDLLPDDSHIKLKHTKACIIIYPGSNQNAQFIFDNSSNHSVFAKDALLVSQMNMGDGTKMPLLHNSIKPDGSLHIMTYIDDKEIIEAASHMCIFYPKFHYKLNYIESFWAKAKHVARLYCDYSFRGLKRTVSRVLNSINLIKICRFARHFERFMSVYKLELSGKVAAFVVKKYRSYHQIPKKVLEEFAHN
ncbi:4101_t:CDS:2, partial [Racocetra persica]